MEDRDLAAHRYRQSRANRHAAYAALHAARAATRQSAEAQRRIDRRKATAEAAAAAAEAANARTAADGAAAAAALDWDNHIPPERTRRNWRRRRRPGGEPAAHAPPTSPPEPPVLRPVEAALRRQTEDLPAMEMWQMSADINPPPLRPGAARPTVVDAYCGGGGASLGWEAAGYTVFAGIDNSKDALKCFAANHPDAIPIEGDTTRESFKIQL